jgi:hypothetical protein
MLIEQIVGTSSAPGDRCLCCKVTGESITLASFIPLLPRCYREARTSRQAALGVSRIPPLVRGACGPNDRFSRRRKFRFLAEDLISDAARKAKTSYHDLFAVWNDADPDVPILKQAKAEYASLNQGGPD